MTPAPRGDATMAAILQSTPARLTTALVHSGLDGTTGNGPAVVVPRTAQRTGCSADSVGKTAALWCHWRHECALTSDHTKGASGVRWPRYKPQTRLASRPAMKEAVIFADVPARYTLRSR